MIEIKPGMYIGVRLLEKLGACEGEVENFRLAFPHGLRLTEKSILAALDNHLSVHWFMRRILRHGADGILLRKTASEFDSWIHSKDGDLKNRYYEKYASVAMGLIRNPENLKGY